MAKDAEKHLRPFPLDTMSHSVLGLDIGGANLKAAHSSGQTVLQQFELWKSPGDLGQALAALIGRFPAVDCLAVTMTGELCDCFETKRQGVHAILDALAEAAPALPVLVWTTGGTFVNTADARAEPHLIAAANWLALATFAGRYLPAGPGLVVDIGSTTSDVIPLRDGRPVPRGRTDVQRLAHRELVYTGVTRTPVCALLGSAGAAEWFATTLDVYSVLGYVPEDATKVVSADGRPATRSAAHVRLARMLCGDGNSCTREETTRLAEHIRDRQVGLLRSAMWAVSLASCRSSQVSVALAGSGEFLARLALDLHPAFPASQVLSLGAQFGPGISGDACAFALAQLALEHIGNSKRKEDAAGAIRFLI